MRIMNQSYLTLSQLALQKIGEEKIGQIKIKIQPMERNKNKISSAAEKLKVSYLVEQNGLLDKKVKSTKIEILQKYELQKESDG